MTRPPADFELYLWGLVHASVCTSLSDEEATARLNAEHPTGLKHGWAVSDAETFSGGEPNPTPCPDRPGNRHILFSC